MSWEDENVAGLEESLPEYYWSIGKHRTKEGKVIKIEEMDDSHLINTYNYFEKRELRDSCAVLLSEMKKRGL